jgi:hypothetical protein
MDYGELVTELLQVDPDEDSLCCQLKSRLEFLSRWDNKPELIISFFWKFSNCVKISLVFIPKMTS